MDVMEKEHMKELVLDFIKNEYLDEEEIDLSYETPLISNGLVDSFSMVSLLVFLENKFSIKIPPSRATRQSFDNVNRIIDLVYEYIE
jgi:acyl carrier protein